MHEVKTIYSNDGKKRGVIYYDEQPLNPREEFDNLGKMICWHPRYTLGDVQLRNTGYDPDEYDEYNGDFDMWLTEEKQSLVSLSLYLYDHGGITMSVNRFCDGWDSGCVGVIYASRDAILKEFGNTDPDTLEKVRKILVCEVETYDEFLTGQVYGFRIFENVHHVERCKHCNEITKEWDEEEDTDSCWGFFGLKHVRDEVTSILNYKSDES